jgi:hypothetical protein
LPPHSAECLWLSVNFSLKNFFLRLSLGKKGDRSSPERPSLSALYGGKSQSTAWSTRMAKSDKNIEALQPRDNSPALASAWSPLRNSVFRALWIATVVSNIGTWMQDVGESWLMTSLSASPILVALVETAGALPVVLVALPAGALADIIDRRRLLLFMQGWMVVAAGAMGVLALMGQRLLAVYSR